MSFSPFTQYESRSVAAKVRVEPIYTVLTAMSMLTAPNLDSEKEPWLAVAATRLTSAQRHANQIVFEWFGNALLSTTNHISFANLVSEISSASADDLRDQILQGWTREELQGDDTLESLLADEERFIEFVTSASASLHPEQEVILDVYALLTDPPRLQNYIVTHLHTLWEAEFADEWEKKRSTMQYCATELNARPWPTESAIAVLQAFIRGAIPDYIIGQLSGVQQIKIVPSPYIHLYATRFGSPETLWLFMLADFWQLPMRTEPIKRGEVKGPASALADDTRLRILELLAAHEELRAQEIIAQLDASQSTVSRHLKQLSSAQFITEKRAGDANKIYRLNRARVSEFAHTLTMLLSTENAKLVLNDVRLEQPEALRPYLNRDGLITQWPAKWTAKKIVLDYLITKFAEDTQYKETEVNEIINQWHTYEDPVYLRRALVDSGLLKRTSDGRQYWRTG